jgi:2'-5' RNA ligase
VATRRLFFALWPPPGWSERPLAAAQALLDGRAMTGRAVASADVHVTLCFLGAVEEAVVAALCERAAALQESAFELEFEGLELWPRSRVLVAASSRVPAAATELARALHRQARGLGLQPAEQPLRPHVTLMRGVANPQHSCSHPPPPPPPPPPLTLTLTLSPPLRLASGRFYLAQSHELEGATAAASQAPRYLRLDSWPLRSLGGAH